MNWVNYTPSGRCVQRLEYYDKKEGDKPSEIADSLLKTFKTVNGREVIDGRGIEPDEKTGTETMSKFTKALIQNHILFNYATEFRQKNAEISSAEKFKLSEKDLADFKQFMLNQDFSFSSSAEEQLKKWKETTVKEGDFEKIKAEYETILSKLSSNKETNFDKSKDEIKNILENEIVSRYYYQNGRIINGFTSDKSIAKSIEILQNSSLYNTILKK